MMRMMTMAATIPMIARGLQPSFDDVDAVGAAGGA